jgi:hypothetical protein
MNTEIYISNTNQNNFINSVNTGFTEKKVSRDKDKYCILIKRSVLQEEIRMCIHNHDHVVLVKEYTNTPFIMKWKSPD